LLAISKIELDETPLEENIYSPRVRGARVYEFMPPLDITIGH
jgi:hypothetical protein